MPRVIKKLDIKGYRVIRSEQKPEHLLIYVELLSRKRPACPNCHTPNPWLQGIYKRLVRHLEVMSRYCWLEVTHPRFRCSRCGKTFNPVLPGIQPGKQSTEPFRERTARLHHEGICATALARLTKIGAATVERIYQHFNARKAAQRISLECPQILGIDEHTLHKKQRFATTFCDLKNHKVFDIVPGKSRAALETFLAKLQGRDKVKLVCIDLSFAYRNIIRRYFPNAKIVADRFHVVRIITHHFMNLARQIYPQIRYQRDILNLLRMNPKNLSLEQKNQLDSFLAQHPALKILYQKMQSLRALVNLKHQTARQCKKLTVKLLNTTQSLKQSGFEPLKTLADTLYQWAEPIACMWRFTKNNGITEGFHRKMKLIQRLAYGIKNFENYRIRVIAHCG